jgi:dsDNA-specific endonuclease/ATPase MutS2
VIELPIEDSLDLHTFHPRDVKELVTDWLNEVRARGFSEVRIIHGKGTGTLKRIVHGVLDRHPAVLEHRPAEESRGGWGATIVRIRLPIS